MQWSDVSFTPSARTLRQFGGLLLILFGGLSLWEAATGDMGLPFVIPGVLAMLGVVGLIVPAVLRPLFVAWTVVAFPVGWTVSKILLALVFYGLFSPCALLFRLIGRDRLQRSYDPSRPTYWKAKTQPSDIRQYSRQF